MVPDIVAEGLARGWRHIDGSTLEAGRTIEADVVIVGTGAGGGVAAEILTAQGFEVVMVEEGPLRSSRDFNLEERTAYPDLFQEAAGRKTRDKGISIYQGRNVGGSTTVNWTASFRTPRQTLAHWAEVHGVAGLSEDELRPWFERMEQRLNIEPWALPPNANNNALKRGADKLGWSTGVISRNVKNCWDLGYCGLGCPTNAKQSMLVTTIPEALERGALLLSRFRAERLVRRRDRIDSLVCLARDERGQPRPQVAVTVRARHFVLAAGAIGSPALLMRSALPDPHGRVGRRTFLHPVAVSVATMPEPVEAYSGAPQSIYSDHFLWWDGATGRCGYKLEVPPVYPLLAATVAPDFGRKHRGFMRDFPHLQVVIALTRDGFNEASRGGRVELNRYGDPVLDYPIGEFIWDGLRRAYLSMAELQFAAGARKVYPIHEDARSYTRWAEARREIARLPMEILRARVVCAHVMGGCAMGEDPRRSVVDCEGRHHHLANLSIIDGSLFPTSVGTNPQLSIYALAAKLSSRLGESIGDR
ncbi:MAG: GMC family oxidoreductase [Gammaproteobacteria bacterium]